MLYRIKGWEDSVLAAQELELDEPEGTTAAVGFTELNHNNSETNEANSDARVRAEAAMEHYWKDSMRVTLACTCEC